MKNMLRRIPGKIPFRIIYIVFISLIFLGLCLVKTKYSIIGSALIAISIFLALIFALINSMKLESKDLKSFGIVFLIIIWFVIMVGSIGGTMINFIPKLYPGNENMIYNLFISASTALIASLIGVAGTYLGAVYGGTKAIEAVEKQLKKQDEEKLEKEKKDEIIAVRIITKLLKEEIIGNHDKLKERKFYSSIDKIRTDENYDVGLKTYHDSIKFDTFESIKYELIKYPSVKIVEEVIDLYGLLYFLVRNDSTINFINREKGNEKLFALERKINEVISQLE
ncbi:MAG: hypothetical protein AB6733_00175 [Clostridiaceae bacterium]